MFWPVEGSPCTATQHVISMHLSMAQNGSVLFPCHLSAFSSWSNQNWFSLATKALSICPSPPFTSCDKSAACFEPNQTAPFRPATAFLKSSASCAGRLSRNNKKWFKSFTDWVNVFFFSFHRKLGISLDTWLPVDFRMARSIFVFPDTFSCTTKYDCYPWVFSLCLC